MSALADFCAALLPPESGGPPPERAAAAARQLLAHAPGAARAGAGAALVALEAVALARHGRTLGRLEPDERVRLLRAVDGSSRAGSAAIESLKGLVLLAWGARSHAGEAAAVANAALPAREDPELAVSEAPEWPSISSCDAIVIGSGAGGAFAARALARPGLDVVVVEEGERWGVERLRQSDPIDRFGSLYRDGGTTVTLGSPPIALPIGRAVGGTTVVNSGTCYRPPAAVARAWHEREGLALAAPELLDANLADVESTLAVAPSPAEVLGRNAELALAGARALGWQAAPLRRNAPGCRGACQCAIGCPNNAKRGVHLSALPEACRAGARIVSGLRVEGILSERGAAIGVGARRRDGSAVTITAPRIVVAAGATETPPLLRRSGLGGHPRLGANLSIHPALGLRGTFPEPVHSWRGVLQSVGIEQLHERDGVLIEATAAPPGMGAIGLPGIGAALVRGLERAEHTARLGALIADAPSGRVRGARRPLITYRLARRDRERLCKAIEAMTRVMLAAGAERVDLDGGAPSVSHPEQLPEALARVDVGRLHLAAFHPSGTAAAGSDPARHPVDERGRLRGVDGVWVADASILPSCPSVNPQLSIMALAAAVGAAAAM